MRVFFRVAVLSLIAPLLLAQAPPPPSANFSVEKDGPVDAAAGSDVEYDVTVTNLGPDAGGVELSDVVPAGMTFVSATQNDGPAFNCTTPPAGTAGEIQCEIATLGVNASATFTFVMHIPAGTALGTSFDNVAEVSALAPAVDPVAGNNTATVTTTVRPLANLSVAKSGPAEAAAGSDVPYQVVVRNTGPNPGGAELSDDIPAGMTFVSATQNSGPTSTCVTPAVGAGGEIECEIATLAVNASATFTFVLRIDPATAPGTSFVNLASVDAVGAVDEFDEDDTATAVTTTPPPPAADVFVEKSGPSAAGPDTDVTYTIRVANGGPSAATNFSVTDTLPGTMTFRSLSQSGTMLSCTTPAVGTGGTITCTAASYAAGAQTILTLTGRIPAGTLTGTEFTNTAAVDADNDPVEENDVSTVTTTVSEVDVSVVKSGPATALAGSNVSYTLTVANSGPDPALDVILTDALPPNTTFVSLVQNSGPTAGCTTGSTVECVIPALGNGVTAVFTLTLRIGNTTSVSNTAQVRTSSFDTDPADNTSTAVTTVTPVADLAVTKSAPATATAGQTLAFTITATNAGPSSATNVTITDVLPAGTTFGSVTQNSGPAFTCGHAGGTVTCTVAAFAPAATATFTIVVNVAPATTGALANSATISSTTTDPAPANNTSATTSTTVVASADVAVAKSAPASTVAGQNVTFTVTATNAGPSTATNVTVTDVLPAGATFVSTTQTSGPTFTCGQAAGTVTCTIAAFAPGAAATFAIVTSVPAGNTGTLANSATITTSTPDPVVGNNTSATNTAVVASADVGVAKSAPPTAVAGQNVTFTVTATNAGPSTATDVTVTDVLPAGTTFVSTTQTSGPAFACGQAAGTVTCTIATFAPGAAATFSIVAGVAAGTTGTLSNTATITASSPDPAAGNNTSTTSTAVGTTADLAITKNAPASAVSLTTITFNVSATNNGPSSAVNVTLTDVLPANTAFVSATQTGGPTFNCTQAGGTITCTAATLVPGATATFDFVARITADGPLANTATITSPTPDPVPANNSATANTNATRAPADLSITKSATAPLLVPGAPATFHIVVTNNGPGPAANVVVTDVLPAGTTLVSATASQGSCSGTQTVVCTLGTIAAPGNATITLDVRLPSTPGPVVNTASVTSSDADPNAVNNAATANITTAAAANIPTLSPLAMALLALAIGFAAMKLLQS